MEVQAIEDLVINHEGLFVIVYGLYLHVSKKCPHRFCKVIVMVVRAPPT